MTGPSLAVSHPVIREVIRRAAVEAPGVLRIGRGGPAWRRALAGGPVTIRVEGGTVAARVFVVARPGQPLALVAGEVRHATAAAIERLLGLRAGTVSVVIDGVGA
jgi:uncharacterized alkaline shock family protein YloU